MSTSFGLPILKTLERNLPDKSWYETFALSPWTGFFMNSIGLLLSLIGIAVANGAKKAARDTRDKINNFNRSIDINSLSNKIFELKMLLNDINLNKDRIIILSSSVREGCVRLKADKVISKESTFVAELDSCITFFATVELHSRDGSFNLNSDIFNSRHDFIITLSEKTKELNNGTT